MKLTEKNIYSQLQTVIDPELHIDIVSLGLIYDVKLIKKNDQPFVKITMTLTTPGCPLVGMIQTMIKDSLFIFRDQGLDVNQDVDVEITFDPPWTMDMMSQEARAELGFD